MNTKVWEQLFIVASTQIALFLVLDPDGEDISINGTIKLCEDLDKDPEDVVLLAVAYELKSPEIGCWTKKGWVEGWKTNGYVVACIFS